MLTFNSALWLLHEYNLRISGEPLKRDPSYPPRISLLALQSLTRTAIETSRNKLDNQISGARYIPSFSLHFLRAALKFHIKMGPEAGSDETWSHELESLARYLQVVGLKWKRDRRCFHSMISM